MLLRFTELAIGMSDTYVEGSSSVPRGEMLTRLTDNVDALCVACTEHCPALRLEGLQLEARNAVRAKWQPANEATAHEAGPFRTRKEAAASKNTSEQLRKRMASLQGETSKRWSITMKSFAKKSSDSDRPKGPAPK